MTSYVDIDEDIDLKFDIEELSLKLLNAVCESEDCPYEACVNVYVTHSDEVKEYNREYRDKDVTTDVLSFPSGEFDPETGEYLLGDILINADRVYSQSEEYGHSVLREFSFLMTHSLLHLFGYDHMNDEEAAVMEEKQESILTKLGITRD